MRLVLLACLTGLVWAQGPKIDEGAIEKSVLEELRATKTPGAAIGVVLDGKLAYARGFGTSNRETGAPVTPEMLFRLGSTTKMLTATAVASLAAEGKLNFSDAVGQHVRGLDPAIAKLTIAQILSHTSGLKDSAVMNGRHDDAALGEEIHAWKADWLFTKPAGIYSYSNPGYWLAGYVAEVVAGAPYAAVMEKRVFEPVGMTRSTLRPTVAMTYPFSQGHDGNGVLRPAPDNTANWPAGSVFSSVNDLAKFVIAMMSGGLPAKVVEALTTPHADVPGWKGNYGFGLSLEHRDGFRVWSHGGARAGYGSFIAMYPERRMAVVVLCNRTGESLVKTRARIAEMLGVADPAEGKMSDRAITEAEWGRYAGTYRNGEQSIRLAVRDGRLMMDKLEVRLRSDGVLATRGAEGKPDGHLVPVAGPGGRIAFLHSGGRSMARVVE